MSCSDECGAIFLIFIVMLVVLCVLFGVIFLVATIVIWVQNTCKNFWQLRELRMMTSEYIVEDLSSLSENPETPVHGSVQGNERYSFGVVGGGVQQAVVPVALPTQIAVMHAPAQGRRDRSFPQPLSTKSCLQVVVTYLRARHLRRRRRIRIFETLRSSVAWSSGPVEHFLLPPSPMPTYRGAYSRTSTQCTDTGQDRRPSTQLRRRLARDVRELLFVHGAGARCAPRVSEPFTCMAKGANEVSRLS